MSSSEFVCSVMVQSACDLQRQYSTNNYSYLFLFLAICTFYYKVLFQHHKKLLQADICVYTQNYESRGCKNQEILHTFKSPGFLGLALDSVQDVCQGHVKDKTSVSVMTGSQWGRWKKTQEKLRKNCLNHHKGLEKHGSGWRGVAGLYLCSACLWFDSIPLRSDSTLTCTTPGHS